jgi:hypothetical protein
MSGMEYVSCAATKEAASAMENLGLETRAHMCAPLARLLSLTVVVTGVEWLMAPDGPVTISLFVSSCSP